MVRRSITSDFRRGFDLCTGAALTPIWARTTACTGRRNGLVAGRHLSEPLDRQQPRGHQSLGSALTHRTFIRAVLFHDQPEPVPAASVRTLALAVLALASCSGKDAGSPAAPAPSAALAAPTAKSPVGGVQTQRLRPTLEVNNAVATGSVGTVTYRFELSGASRLSRGIPHVWPSTMSAQGAGDDVRAGALRAAARKAVLLACASEQRHRHDELFDDGKLQGRQSRVRQRPDHLRSADQRPDRRPRAAWRALRRGRQWRLAGEQPGRLARLQHSDVLKLQGRVRRDERRSLHAARGRRSEMVLDGRRQPPSATFRVPRPRLEDAYREAQRRRRRRSS